MIYRMTHSMAHHPVDTDLQAPENNRICTCLDQECEDCSTRELSRSVMAEVMFPVGEEWPSLRDVDIGAKSSTQSCYEVKLFPSVNTEYDSPEKERISSCCWPRLIPRTTKSGGDQLMNEERIRNDRRSQTRPSSSTADKGFVSMHLSSVFFDEGFSANHPGAPLLRGVLNDTETEQYLDHATFPALFPDSRTSDPAFFHDCDKSPLSLGMLQSRQQPGLSKRGSHFRIWKASTTRGKPCSRSKGLKTGHGDPKEQPSS